MKQIRQSAFETNSSSCHSITIAAGEFIPDTLPVEDGVCSIYTGEFGWTPEDFTDAATKAAYCLTWIKQMANRGRSRLTVEPEPQPPSREEQMLVNVIKSVTGATDVRFVPSDDYWPWGYIDHQSIEGEGGALIPAWFSEETLRSFIFNPNSVLHTDNDNR